MKTEDFGKLVDELIINSRRSTDNERESIFWKNSALLYPDLVNSCYCICNMLHDKIELKLPVAELEEFLIYAQLKHYQNTGIYLFPDPIYISISNRLLTHTVSRQFGVYFKTYLIEEDICFKYPILNDNISYSYFLQYWKDFQKYIKRYFFIDEVWEPILKNINVLTNDRIISPEFLIHLLNKKNLKVDQLYDNCK